MNSRDRFRATCRFEPVDRPFRFETIGFWPETIERWHKEGLPEDRPNHGLYSVWRKKAGLRKKDSQSALLYIYLERDGSRPNEVRPQWQNV
jgi:hypothetical protein